MQCRRLLEQSTGISKVSTQRFQLYTVDTVVLESDADLRSMIAAVTTFVTTTLVHLEWWTPLGAT